MLKRNHLAALHFSWRLWRSLCILILLIPLVGISSVAAMPDRPPLMALSPTLSTTTSTVDWHPLPNQGLDYIVFALAVKDDDLYIAGDFSQVGDGSVTNLGGIVRYNTTTRTWHALSNQGLNDDIRALAIVGDDLFVGGNFTATGDGSLTNLGHLARYDIATDTWHALPKQGVNGVVWALEASGTDVFAGGNFTQTGDGTMTNLGRLIRYDITSGDLHALPNQGMEGYVFDLLADGDDLYIGGLFDRSGDGSLTNLGYLIRYDTTNMTWHPFPNQGLDDGVYAFLMAGSELYIGGYFTQTGDGATNLNHITRFSTGTNTWHPLSHQGLNARVGTLAMIDNDLYVGGEFTETGDGVINNLGYIVRYDTQSAAWYAFSNQGVNSWVNALAIVNDDLYLGGYFNLTGDGTIDLNYATRYAEEYTVYLPLSLKQ